MTVTENANGYRIQYTCTGLAATLDTEFAFRDAADVRVTSTETSSGNETILTKDTHYTLAAGNGANKNVIPKTPYASTFPVGYIWTIERIEPAAQGDALDNTESIASESHEIRHDRVAMFQQRMLAELDKCVKFPDTELLATVNTLANSVDRADMGLGFDSSGNIQLYAKTVAEVDTVVTSYYISARAMDPDNAHATYKPIVDVMGGCIEFADSGVAGATAASIDVPDWRAGGTMDSYTVYYGCADGTATIPGSIMGKVTVVESNVGDSTTGLALAAPDQLYTVSIIDRLLSFTDSTPQVIGTNEGLRVYFERNPAHASDTLNGLFRVYGIRVNFTPD